MSLRIASVGLFLAAWASAAEEGQEWTWPNDVVYRAKPRSAEWCEKAYQYFKRRIALVDGTWLDVGHLGPEEGRTKLRKGRAGRIRGVVTKVISEDEMLLTSIKGNNAESLARYGVKGVPTRGMLRGEWEGVVYCDEKDVDGWYRFLPAERKEITREQFLEAIASGFELVKWEPLPPAPRVKGVRPPPAGSEVKRRVPVE